MKSVHSFSFELRSSMPIIGAALLMLASSVAGATYEAIAPPHVNLTGTWKLDHDPADGQGAGRRIVRKEHRGTTSGGSLSTSGSPGAAGSSTSGAGQADEADLERMREQMEQRLASAERIHIEQGSNYLSLTTDAGTTACDTTETTQVSTADGGIADRRCGWDGEVFVVELKSPDGSTQRDRYALADDGQQLIVTTELDGGGEARAMNDERVMKLMLRRVYERAEES